MRPFDLEAAKRGEPIQLWDGSEVKFIAHVPEADAGMRVVFLCYKAISTCGEDGSYHGDGSQSSLNLFMAPKKHRREVWVNLYEDGTTDERWWESSSKADNHAYPALHRLGGKAHHVVIEWEE